MMEPQINQIKNKIDLNNTRLKIVYFFVLNRKSFITSRDLLLREWFVKFWA